MENIKWEDLPIDCLVNVFGRLKLDDRTFAVPLVCKSWYTAYLNPDCWKILKFHESDLAWYQEYDYLPEKSVVFTQALRSALHRSRGSATVVTFPPICAALSDLVLVSEQCPLLQVLYMPHFYWEELQVLYMLRFYPTSSEEKLRELICKWKDLQFLYLPNLPSNFGAVVEEINHHCKNFTRLQACGRVGNETTLAIIKWLPRIKYLVLNGSSISKKNLLIILHGCRELEQLSVDNCRGFNVDEEILQKSSHIKNFTSVGSILYDWDEDDYSDDYSAHSDDYYDDNDFAHSDDEYGIYSDYEL